MDELNAMEDGPGCGVWFLLHFKAKGLKAIGLPEADSDAGAAILSLSLR